MNSDPFLIELRSSPSKDVFAIMSEATLCFASVVNEALDSEILDLIYLFTIFFVCFIRYIHYNATQHTCQLQTHQLYHMLLLTFLHWLDLILLQALYPFYDDMTKVTPRMLQGKLAVKSLVLWYVEAHAYSFLVF